MIRRLLIVWFACALRGAGRAMRLLVVVMLFACAGCKAIVTSSFEPDEPFSATEHPPTPDYASQTYWASRPEKADNADRPMPGVQDGQRDAQIDVFFVHPTTYFSDDFWNSPVLDVDAAKGVDDQVLLNQASVFNGTARVFAPRYRQATFGAFTTEVLAERSKALDFAYQDVKAAFEYYLGHDNHGRPFFIGSHSQGSQHAVRLIYDFIVGKPLQNRMIAAYIVGTPVSERVLDSTWKGVPLCDMPTATGCIVNYNTIARGANRTRFFDKSYTWLPGRGLTRNSGAGLLCVNPVSFRTDNVRTPPAAHRGAWRFGTDKTAPDANFLAAQCVDGLLEVELENRDYDVLLGRWGDYHLMDYSLFYVDLRNNIDLRATTWLRNHGAPVE